MYIYMHICTYTHMYTHTYTYIQEYPLRAPNNFELSLMTRPTPTTYHSPIQDFYEGPRVRIVSPGACVGL